MVTRTHEQLRLTSRSLTWRARLIGIVLASSLPWAGQAAEPERSPPGLAPDRAQLLNERESLNQRVVILRREGNLEEGRASGPAGGRAHPSGIRRRASASGRALKQLAAVYEEAEDWAGAQATWQEVVQLGTQLYGASHYRVTDARLTLQHVQVLARLDPGGSQASGCRRPATAGSRSPGAGESAGTRPPDLPGGWPSCSGNCWAKKTPNSPPP